MGDPPQVQGRSRRELAIRGTWQTECATFSRRGELGNRVVSDEGVKGAMYTRERVR
jgi:hypothetical protein